MDSFEYSINYHLQSSLNEESPDRYVNDYEAEILVYKSSGEFIQIGRVQFNIILVNQVRENNYNLFHVFDASSSILDFGMTYVDFETEEFNDTFMELTNNEMYLDNICLITEYDLLPAFRGKNIGAKIMKDIYLRFSTGVGAFFIKAIPFQSSLDDKGKNRYNEEDEFLKAMNFGDFEFDEETAQYKINAFFQRLGFKYLNDNYFYIDSNFQQPKLMSTDW